MDDYLETFQARGYDYNEVTSLCPDAREAERKALLDRLNCVTPPLSNLSIEPLNLSSRRNRELEFLIEAVNKAKNTTESCISERP